MTILVLIVLALIALAAIASPIITYMRRPWQFNAPSGAEETLRQEQIMALDALRDLAMDYRMGQLSEEDYRSLAAPLQKRAKQTINDLPLAGLDAELNELDAELEAAILALRTVDVSTAIVDEQKPDAASGARRFCTQCGEEAKPDYLFCGACGTKLPESKPAEPAIAAPRTEAAIASSSIASQLEASRPEASQLEASSTVAEAESAIAGPSLKRWLAIGAAVAAIFVAGVIWVYLSGRAGQTNQTPIATFADGPIAALAVTAGQAVVSASDGLRVSADLTAWTQRNTVDTFLSVTAVYGESNTWVATGSQGVWRTVDNGQNWTLLAIQSDTLGIQLVASAPDGTLWGANPNQLFSSADQGQTWTDAGSVMPGVVQALAVGPQNIFVGTAGQGVFRSPDRGVSWINSNSIVNGRIGNLNIQALAFDATGRNLFAGTPTGLYFFNLDNVAGWGRRTLDENVRALAIPAGEDNILWAGTVGGEVFRSQDRGVTWRN